MAARGARDGPGAADARRPTAVDRAPRARPSFADRPGSVATAFGFGAAAPLPLEDIARREGVELRRGALAAVDADRRLATSDHGQQLGYDALVVATGARARPAIQGAVTFSGPDDVAALERLIARAAAGTVRRLAFVLPSGVSWSLPVYELAIMAAVELRTTSCATRASPS